MQPSDEIHPALSAEPTRYYVGFGHEVEGPLTLDELKLRGLDPSTRVARVGEENWTTAEELPEIHGALRATHPAELRPTAGTESPFAPPAPSNDVAYQPEYEHGLDDSPWGKASLWTGVAAWALLAILSALPSFGWAPPAYLYSFALPAVVAVALAIVDFASGSGRHLKAFIGAFLGSSMLLVCIAVWSFA